MSDNAFSSDHLILHLKGIRIIDTNMQLLFTELNVVVKESVNKFILMFLHLSLFVVYPRSDLQCSRSARF